MDSLPELLVDPPWEKAARRSALTGQKEPAQRVVPGLEPPSGLAVAWAPGWREQWREAPVYLSAYTRTLDELINNYLAGQPVYPPIEAAMLATGPEERIRPLVPDWRPKYITPRFGQYLRRIVERYEGEARPAMLYCAGLSAPYCGEALLPYLDAEVVRLMADWMFRLKSAHHFTRDYFTGHGLATVPFLVPDAVGKARPSRRKATAALALVAAEHGVDAVVKAARVFGDEPAEIVAEALSAGTPIPGVHGKPAESPKPPRLAWLDVAALPRPVLRDSGEALPPAATGNLVSLLALSGQTPYEGLPEIFDLCAPGSLAAFSWAIFEAWRAAGEPSRNGWVLSQLAWLGDDGTVRRLTPIIRVWPGQSGHAKAVKGLEVLTAIGTDVALIHLNGIAQKVKFNGLKRAARRAIAEVAESRGLTPDELADRLVPDFGLDAEGGLTLDYGPRSFRVSFDEQLKPYVTDSDGKPRKTLPQPGAKDDPGKAPAAYQRYAALKKDVRTIAADQIRRLEAAMVAGRRWTPEEFRASFADHPLIRHIARRLVWLADDRSFRIAEDRTLADSADTEFTLPASARIGIAHPLHLGEDAAAWSELFADYEITQPFPQLGRPVHALTGDERAASRLAAFAGARVPTGMVLGLIRYGWERGIPQDGGVEHDISLQVTPDRAIMIYLDPGIAAGAVDVFPEQTIREVLIYKTGGVKGDAAFGELDPVIASEVLAQLTALTGG